MSARLYSPDCPTPNTTRPPLHGFVSTAHPCFAHKATPQQLLAAQAVPFSSPPRDFQHYRRSVFSIFENEFCLEWERRIEPSLIYTSKTKPYYHCLVLMKAIRRLLRLEVNNEGALVWTKPDSFTHDESLMTSRGQLFQMCCRFKPGFTFSQYRIAMMLLRRYKILFCTYGRRPGKKTGGTILFLRLNASYLGRLLKGAEVEDRELVPGSITDRIVSNVSIPSGQETSSRDEGSKTINDVKVISISNREKAIVDLLTGTPNLFQSREDWDQHCTKTNFLNLAQFRDVRRLVRQGVLTLKFVQDYCSFMSLGVGWLVNSDGAKTWWANCDINFFLLRCSKVRKELYRHHANDFEANSLPLLDDAAILEDLRVKANAYYAIDTVTDVVDPLLLAHAPSLPADPTEHDLRTNTEHAATRAITACRAFESGQLADGAYALAMRQSEPHLRAWLVKHPHHAEWCLRNLPSFCKWIDITADDRWQYRRDAVQLDYAEQSRLWVAGQARQNCFWR